MHHPPPDLFDCTLPNVLEFFAFNNEKLGFIANFHVFFWLDFVQKYDGWIVRKAAQNQPRRRGILPRCDGTRNR